jgi:hypothetical protein
LPAAHDAFEGPSITGEDTGDDHFVRRFVCGTRLGLRSRSHFVLCR